MNTTRPHGFANRTITLVMAAALAAGLGLFAAQHYFGPQSRAVKIDTASLKAVRLMSAPRELPDYRLTLSDGNPLTPATLRGHWTVVFLGFTHCPDVCPTTLSELAKAQKAWEALPEKTRPRLLFVSVDPERDTPAKTGQYAHFFHPATLAASTEPAALADFTQSLGLVYMKIPLENDDYTIDHSATLVVLDPQGRQAGLIRPPLDPKAIADDLRLLSESAP